MIHWSTRAVTVLARRIPAPVAALFSASLLLVAGTPAATAQQAAVVAPAAPETTKEAGYEPFIGQEGKDVIWVPTPQELVERMLNLAQVKPGELLFDLGSGDGRTVITAAQRGLRAVGIEYEPAMVDLARRRATEAGVADRARFEKADLYETDLSAAQVITLFLLPSINERLRPRLLELAPGTRIVSNTFGMGDWSPDGRSDLGEGCTAWCSALLWIVPARVAGTWQVGNGTLVLQQQYQVVTGQLGDRSITAGHLRGGELTFDVDGRRYAGTVDGDRIDGRIVTRDGVQGTWTATRAPEGATRPAR